MVRSASLILSLGTAIGAVAQGAETIGGDRDEHAIQLIAELREATTDSARDRLDELLRSEMRAMLEAEDGPTRDLSHVPLSRVDAPDGRFRLLTWNYPLEDGSYRYSGSLLVVGARNTAIFDLMDRTAEIANASTAELGPDRWYGALYYDILPVKKGGKTYYMLLGWKGHSRIETRKIIEVLSFRGDKPRLGADLFEGGRLPETRKIYAYSFQATMHLEFRPEEDRIVMDHLNALRPELSGQAAFTGPDLSYDAYQWNKGRWIFERDVDVKDLDPDRRPYNAPPKPPGP